MADNKALNALRATAALLVVVGHARAYLFVSRDDAPHDPLTQGILAVLSMEHGAVLVFFVLSGYFVGGSSIRAMAANNFSWNAYMVSRLVRLWLVLIPAIVLTLILDLTGRIWLSSSPRYSSTGDAVTNTDLPTILGNVFFLQPMYVAVLGSNRALWSVSYEFAYYAAFPLLLAGFALSKKWQTRTIFVVAAGLVLAFFGWNVAALFPVWLLGALVAFYKTPIVKMLSRMPSALMFLARLASVLLTAAAMVADKIAGGSPSSTPPTSYAVALAATLLTALLLPDLNPQNRIMKRALSSTANLAQSSFSLYAIHLPLLSLVAAAVSPKHVTGSWQPSIATWLAFAVIVCTLVAFGWLFSQYTERHTNAVRRWVHRSIATRRPPRVRS